MQDNKQAVEAAKELKPRPELKIAQYTVEDATTIGGSPDSNRYYRWVQNKPMRIYSMQGKGYQLCTDPNVYSVHNPTEHTGAKYLGGVENGDLVLMETSRDNYVARRKEVAKKFSLRKTVNETKQSLAIKDPRDGSQIAEGIGDIYEGADATPQVSGAALERLQNEVATLKKQLELKGQGDLAKEAISEMEEQTKLPLSNKRNYFISDNPLAKK